MKRILCALFLTAYLPQVANAGCPFVTENPQMQSIASRLQALYTSMDEKNTACRAAIRSAVDSIRSTDEIADAAFDQQSADFYEMQDINRQMLTTTDDEDALKTLVDRRATLEASMAKQKRKDDDAHVRSAQEDAFKALSALTSASASQACRNVPNGAAGVMDAGLGLLTLASPALAAGNLAIRAGGRLLQGLFNMFTQMGQTSAEKLENFTAGNTYLCMYYEMMSLQCRFETQKLDKQQKALSGLQSLASTFNPSELPYFKALGTAQNQVSSVTKGLVDLSMGRLTGGATTVEGVIAEQRLMASGGDTRVPEEVTNLETLQAVSRAFDVIPTTAGVERSAALASFTTYAGSAVQSIIQYRRSLGTALSVMNPNGGVREDVDWLAIWTDPAKRNLIMTAAQEMADIAKSKQSSSGGMTSVDAVARVIKQDAARWPALQAMNRALDQLIQPPSSSVSPDVAAALEAHRATLTHAKKIVAAATACVDDPGANASSCGAISGELRLTGTLSVAQVKQAVEREVAQHLASLQRAMIGIARENTSDPFATTLQPAAGAGPFERYLAVSRSIDDIRSLRDPDPADIQDIRILRGSFEDSRSTLNIIGRGLDLARIEPERMKQICAMMRYTLRSPAGKDNLIPSCKSVPNPSRFGSRAGACAYNDYMIEEQAKDRACTGRITRFPIEPSPSCTSPTVARPAPTGEAAAAGAK